MIVLKGCRRDKQRVPPHNFTADVGISKMESSTDNPSPVFCHDTAHQIRQHLPIRSYVTLVCGSGDVLPIHPHSRLFRVKQTGNATIKTSELLPLVNCTMSQLAPRCTSSTRRPYTLQPLEQPPREVAHRHAAALSACRLVSRVGFRLA